MPFERKPPGQKWRFSLDKVDTISGICLSRKNIVDTLHFFAIISYVIFSIILHSVRRVESWAGFLPSALRMNKLNNKIKILVLTVVCMATAMAGARLAKANLAFGTGYYTNLCGSGTAADRYACEAACNTATATCGSNSGGVVRYVCSGKWDQCLESEEWGNSKQVGQAACGKTVQLSVYDKKCRMEDGSWDPTCKLRGYMVWYSGDCWGNNTPAPTLTVNTPIASNAASPTLTSTPRAATPTPTIKPTVVPPTQTPSPTPTTAPKIVCDKVCKSNTDCGAGFTCFNGVCRNPSCTDDKTCFCNIQGAATGSGKSASPETGISAWWGVAGMIMLGGMGWKMRRWAEKIW